MFIEQLETSGFALLKVGAQVSTIDVARGLGEVCDLNRIAQVQTLVPKPIASCGGSSYSHLFGMGEFPLHTDMAHWVVPPRYILLRAVTVDPLVTTRILSGYYLLGCADENDFARALFRPRRQLEGRLSPLRLWNGSILRWDLKFIVPVTKIAVELRGRILELLADTAVLDVQLESPDTCLLIDNWRALHGRSAVPDGSFRCIERVYLNKVYP